MKLQPEWGWVVGTGIYVDDVKAEMAAIFTIFIISVVVISAMAIGLSILLTRSITVPVNRAIDALAKAPRRWLLLRDRCPRPASRLPKAPRNRHLLWRKLPRPSRKWLP